MSAERRTLGIEGELAAEKFLRRQRYTILARNYTCKAGEVDLIALDGTTIVFVEVKARTQDEFGSPFDAVDARKRRQVRRAAQFYIAQNRLLDRDARFDVVGVRWEDGSSHCELIRNAF